MQKGIKMCKCIDLLYFYIGVKKKISDLTETLFPNYMANTIHFTWIIYQFEL